MSDLKDATWDELVGEVKARCESAVILCRRNGQVASEIHCSGSAISTLGLIEWGKCCAIKGAIGDTTHVAYKSDGEAEAQEISDE